ncbi:MAG: hypothetical protein K6T27_01880 [Thermoleophilum sp.]|nr:hypothetical protein [Thermoleophilum sp.]
MRSSIDAGQPSTEARRDGRLRRRLPRPSPALVVATIALIAAVAGTAQALPGTATVYKDDIRQDAVGSSEIMANAVGPSEIRTGAVGKAEAATDSIGSLEIIEESITGAQVKKDSLTGEQINEATLGAVPSANGLADMRAVRVAPFTLGAGESRELLRQGPLVISARCALGVNNEDAAEILVDSTVDNAALDGHTRDPDLDAADAPARLAAAVAQRGQAQIDQEASATAIAPGGTEVIGSPLYTAVNALGESGRCRFGGIFLVR